MPAPIVCSPAVRTVRLRWHLPASLVLLLLSLAAGAQTSATQPPGTLLLERQGRTLAIVPYAPNIVRVTFSTTPADATTPPGPGLLAQPATAGWTADHQPDGTDILRSGSLVVRLAPEHLTADQRPQPMPLDTVNNKLRSVYFPPGTGPRTSFDDALTLSAADGKPLLHLRSWSMEPEPAEVAAYDTGHGHRVSATFDAPTGEHFYGLGEQQQGWMDLRDHQIHCWHEYNALGGEHVCVPLLISTGGYALLWDNPSRTTIDLGFNNQTSWQSEVGDRVSFFVITGPTTDDLYAGYRHLSGITHLLPRAAYGYIQSKAIYPTQQQLLDVAHQYRARNLPLDVLVVDFLNMTHQGELDLDPTRWPDPAAMNRELHGMGIHSLLSVWPHFAEGTQFYTMLRDKGWLIHKPDGTPDGSGFASVIGPNLDTTNPQAAAWFWQQIRDRYLKPFGFDYLWLDETEPDIDPLHDVFAVGPGIRFYNVYPLFHTAAVYEGFRRDFGDSRRVMILARAAYTGAQRNGTVFWSSDIVSTWDMLRRSIPAGLNFTATGLPYWDTDIAGFFSPWLPPDYHAPHTPLLDGSDVRANIGRYEDYPELFTRWFQWGTFQPVMRAHGERDHNEVWAYGKQAEPILSKYLRLRYQLLPYIYSAAFHSYQTGAPYMRALFMDFPTDAKAADIPDEYMFGPAFLVAPVTEQGATHRSVYLPVGPEGAAKTLWYNFWTGEQLHGGQTVEVAAPIDTLPLFVRAGSIIPFGSEVLSASAPQSISSVRVYPGSNGSFTLFQDDGTTYQYEHPGADATSTLLWDDSTGRLSHTGAAPWAASAPPRVEVVGREAH